MPAPGRELLGVDRHYPSTMPVDDPRGEGDPADDPTAYGPPLHPDDRLWRHPSEVGRDMRSASGDPSGEVTVPVVALDADRRRWRPGVGTVAVGVLSGVLASLLTVSGLALTGALDGRVVERITEAASGPRSLEATTQPALLTTGTPDVAGIARRVEPALARLEVTTTVGRQTGTAVAVRTDGVFLTSADLLVNATDVTLVLTDGERLKATLVGVDRVTNLGVLRIAAKATTAPTWGDSAALVFGSDAIVVGAAEQNARSPSVAKGVVSAVGATYVLDDGTTLHDLIQTDANMVRGTKGGVLLSGNGSVVGIITTVGKDETGSDRTGFAMPIEYARALAESYIQYGHPSPVWLGIVGRTLPKDRADSLGVPGGVQVDTVAAQSPAQVAGIAAGDIIVAADQRPVETWSAMNLALRRLDPGDMLPLTIRRGDETLQTLTFVSRQPESYTDPPATQ